MYAYTANLKESGKGSFEDTVLKAAVAKSRKNAEQRNSASWNFSEKNRLGKNCKRYYAVEIQLWRFEGIHGVEKIFRIFGYVGISVAAYRYFIHSLRL